MDTASIISSAGTLAHSSGFSSFTGGLTPGQFFMNMLSIILIDIVLSGDNSIVIAMAVHTLPKDKRIKGILLGTLGAILMRVGLTWIAAHLLQTPFLKMIGGAAILWIAVKLLLEEAAAEANPKKVESLWHAVLIILIADFTMSLDNVLAVAGVSKGDPLQLWLSLGLTIPLIVFSSSILSKLMDRYPIILILGAALLGKVGGEMIITDLVLVDWYKIDYRWLTWSVEAICALGVIVLAKILTHRLKAHHDPKAPKNTPKK